MPTLRPLVAADLDAVVALEADCHDTPWSRRQFEDSLAAGHLAWVLVGEAGLLGYLVAMPGVDEMHLLDLTVAPACRGRGHARQLLGALAEACRAAKAALLWLEVRDGNADARRLYAAWGFEPVGRRKGYYARAQGGREDAVVMRWPVPAEAAA